ncbi:MAG TPA: LPS export ABC transporter permease LptF [Pseudorhodoplanes sp.]|jgi:lipopolysaccharide export system permease protein|nr:LPS export ABC transporter permease LptF [Pseudorhodoplanes sp.]
MGSIDRYIFRTTFSAFLVVLVCLTAVIWITQALRDLDLMTSQGQTILVFVGITGLIIPLLILVIAPIALVMAVVHVLNKLSTDSELIVMNAAGMSPLVLFRSFLMVVAAVSVLVAFVSAYLAPKGLRELREWITQVRADVVANIVQPGRFTGIERGVVFHIRERQPNGVLRGIFVDDQRDPKERITMLAEQGTIVKNDEGTFLVLENGSIQRQEQGERDPTIVMYDRHAFDLSRFGGSGPQTITYSPRERYLWELLSPAPNDPVYRQQPQQFRAELHERLTGLLYPIVFVIVAYAYLGPPRTTRQSREFSIVSAAVAVTGVRLLGFACSVLSQRYAAAVLAHYVLLFATAAFGIRAIAKGLVIEPPAFATNFTNIVMARLQRRSVAR